MRNSEVRLNIRIAVPTGTNTTSSKSNQSDCRRGDHADDAETPRADAHDLAERVLAAEQLAGDADPEHDLVAALVESPGGRNAPEPTARRRTSANSAVVPITGTARPRSPQRTVSVAAASGPRRTWAAGRWRGSPRV